MSDVVSFEPEKEDDEDYEPAVDSPIDLRPDLTALGLNEIERGVVEDTYENRQVLRGALMRWDTVYSSTGAPTGLIAARTEEQVRERRVISMQEKKPLLVDPTNLNSDYSTGLDLIIDESACRVTPPWVVAATKRYLDEQKRGGPSSPKRQPLAQPQRCRMVKTDGLRCMLWSSGRVKDDGLCRMHLKTQRKPGEDIERARKKLIQAAPYAVDILEDLMENAVSEPVKLKASTEILDRAGVRGGMELDVGVDVTDSRSPAQIIGERLARLADGAMRTARDLVDETDIQDAEVVTDEQPAAASAKEKVIAKLESAAAAAEPAETAEPEIDDDGEAVATLDITDDELSEFAGSGDGDDK
jgi:hypothetical protein